MKSGILLIGNGVVASLMQPVRTAVVGCGIAGQELHIPAVKNLDATRLVAVCDTNEEVLSNVTDGTCVSGYTDYQTLLSEEEIESVNLCTPCNVKPQQAIDALSRGVSVLIEKPAALNVDRVDAVIEARDTSDAVASVVHNRLFLPQIQEALAAVKTGSLGDVISVSYIYSEKQNLDNSERDAWVYSLPGIELGEGLPHQIYVPAAFTSQPDTVRGIHVNEFSTNTEARFDELLLSLANERARDDITIRVSTNSIDHATLIVFGTEGVLVVPLNLFGTYLFRTDNKIKNTIQVLKQIAISIFNRMSDRIRNNLESNTHHVLIRKHARSVRGYTDPPVPLENARIIAKTLEQLNGPDEKTHNA